MPPHVFYSSSVVTGGPPNPDTPTTPLPAHRPDGGESAGVLRGRPGPGDEHAGGRCGGLLGRLPGQGLPLAEHPLDARVARPVGDGWVVDRLAEGDERLAV